MRIHAKSCTSELRCYTVNQRTFELSSTFDTPAPREFSRYAWHLSNMRGSYLSKRYRLRGMRHYAAGASPGTQPVIPPFAASVASSPGVVSQEAIHVPDRLSLHVHDRRRLGRLVCDRQIQRVQQPERTAAPAQW